MKRIKIIFFFLLVSLCPIIAQSPVQQLQLISAIDLKEDFRLLREGLEKTHAGLYVYTSKDSLDKAFNRIEGELNQPLTAIDFYRKITPLLKLIGNGHTNFFAPPDFIKAINTNLPLFPFAVYWNQDTLYILRNYSDDTTIKEGTIIKSINGESTKTLMQYFVDRLTRDGYNESYPKEKIVQNFNGYYALFRGTPTTFDLELIKKNGTVKNVTLKGVITSNMVQTRKKKYPNLQIEKGLPLQFSIKNNIGYLTVNSFEKPKLKKAKQKYKAFFKATFQELKTKKVQNLIIDIRDNGGGYPEVVNELFSYLIEQPYEGTTEGFTITKNLPNRKHYKYGFWEILDIRKSLKLKKEGPIYRVTGNNKHSTVHPAQNTFKGRLYILANPYTFSAATDFMGMLRNVNRGVFIGEIAGGSPHHVTAWIMPSLILPNTHIEAIIPIVSMTTKNNFPDDGLGIPPDFFIKNSIEDVLKRKDAVMEFTINQIKKRG